MYRKHKVFTIDSSAFLGRINVVCLFCRNFFSSDSLSILQGFLFLVRSSVRVSDGGWRKRVGTTDSGGVAGTNHS